jgi:hypothetical protein
MQFCHRLDSVPVAQFDARTPPMPLLWGPLSMRQNSDTTFHIVVANRADSFRRIVFNGTGRFGVLIDWNQECGIAVKMAGRILRVPGKIDIPANLVLGKGYQKRYWTGKMSSIELTATLANGSIQSVPIHAEQIVH